MDRRLKLHEILCEIVNLTESNGDRHTYFQPPPSVNMKYDAIRYSRKSMDAVHANDAVYLQRDCYEIIVICRSPDSDIPKKVLALPMCRHDRSYIADNLYHDVFTLYY